MAAQKKGGIDPDEMVAWLASMFEGLADGCLHDDLTPRSQGNAFCAKTWVSPVLVVGRENLHRYSAKPLKQARVVTRIDAISKPPFGAYSKAVPSWVGVGVPA